MTVEQAPAEKQLFIGGRWRDAVSGKSFPPINPATEALIAEIAEGDAADIDLAVQAAREAFENTPWAGMSQRDRGKLIWRIGELIMQHAQKAVASLGDLRPDTKGGNAQNPNNSFRGNRNGRRLFR